jgi:hypothetical protein
MAERPYLDVVSIDGIDVLSYVNNYKIKGSKNIDNVTSGSIRLALDIFDILVIETGQEVTISRGISSTTEQYILRGYIMKFQEEDGLILVQVEGRLAQYKRKIIRYSFDKNIDVEAGNVSKIWATIVEGGGLTASYVDSGADIIIDKFLCNDHYRYERLGTLTKLLGWQMRDDYDLDYIRLEPLGYTTYASTLTVGDNIINIPVWQEELESMRNYIKIKGAYEEDTKTEVFAGTGTADTFTVTNEPEITKVTIDGVEKIRGIVGSSTTYDYVVDKQRKLFVFVSPPSGGSSISIQYTYRKPKAIEGKDYTSIGYYNLERGEVYTLKDVMTVEDARLRLNQLLKYLAYAFVKTNIELIGISGINPGMIVNVIDSSNLKYSGSYIVNEITYQYPEPIDLVQIGSTDFNTRNLLESFSQRLLALEQEAELNTEELTQLLSLVEITEMENRYFSLSKATIEPVTLYLDHSTNSYLDDFELGDDTDETATVEILMPGNNKFKEFVYDDVFYDAVSSSGIIFETTTNTIRFDVGGVYVTNAISKGTAYTSYKVIVPDSINNLLTFEISCDAKSSWEPVTLNTLTEFSGITTDVYLRITNNIAYPLDLAVEKDAGNQFLTPAIEVQLS